MRRERRKGRINKKKKKRKEKGGGKPVLFPFVLEARKGIMLR
jgi:hypothetical protein